LLIPLDPGDRGLHRCGHESAVVDPALSAAREKAGVLQNAQVFRDCGK
jgi:hypothetical protein